MDWLSSATRKLGRAKEHRQELSERIDAFVGSDPYFLTAHLDVDRHVYEFVVHYRGSPELPGDLGLLVGDILHNLRSCLDHLAYSLTIRATQDPPPSERAIQFPIVERPHLWEGERKSRIPNVGADVTAAIRSVQPHERGGPYDPLSPESPNQEHPLWVLNSLSNADKHRLIPVVAGTTGGHDLLVSFRDCEEVVAGPEDWFGPIYGDLMMGVTPDGVDRTPKPPLEEGAVHSRRRVTITGPNPVVRIQGSLSVSIGILYHRGRPQQPAIQIVDYIIDYIEESVFAAIREALAAEEF